MEEQRKKTKKAGDPWEQLELTLFPNSLCAGCSKSCKLDQTVNIWECRKFQKAGREPAPIAYLPRNHGK